MINRISTSLKNLCSEGKLKGEISIQINNISCVVESKSGIGSLIEEWFGCWLKSEGIKHSRPDNSQSFPDYNIFDESSNRWPTEIKCFDSSASPNFDVAQFETFARKILDKPEDLNCDYLIFAYSLDSTGIQINDVWRKKIWEITTSSANYPIKLQVKQGTIHNIRPCNWFSKTSKRKPFESKAKFLEAMNNLIQSTQQVDSKIKARWLDWKSFL